MLTKERLADGRLEGDTTLARFSLGRADDRERLVAVLVVDLHGRADLDHAFDVLALDDARVAHQLLEQKDPAFDETLLVLGVIVLGVLVDIAEFLRLANPLSNLGPALVAKHLELRLQAIETLLREVYDLVVFHGSHQKPTYYTGFPARLRYPEIWIVSGGKFSRTRASAPIGKTIRKRPWRVYEPRPRLLDVGQSAVKLAVSPAVSALWPMAMHMISGTGCSQTWRRWLSSTQIWRGWAHALS